jgi:hypothetical protein
MTIRAGDDLQAACDRMKVELNAEMIMLCLRDGRPRLETKIDFEWRGDTLVLIARTEYGEVIEVLSRDPNQRLH